MTPHIEFPEDFDLNQTRINQTRITAEGAGADTETTLREFAEENCADDPCDLLWIVSDLIKTGVAEYEHPDGARHLIHLIKWDVAE